MSENEHHHDYANQTTMEGHTAIPDTEQIQRIIQELWEVVEQNITNTSTEEYAQKPA